MTAPLPLEQHFERRGAYMTRDGAAARAGARDSCNKKLCLVATDKVLLVEWLYEVSNRDDCFFVKYSIEPKDGMFLGRVFLTDAERLGDLWAATKGHPRLMCTLQDDDFTILFRRRHGQL